MSQGPRVLRPERGQLRWDMIDLDSQLPPEHRARLVWSFVAGLKLSEFYARIKARDDTAGRPASDPAVLLAVWRTVRAQLSRTYHLWLVSSLLDTLRA